jgi:diguanylate cyclase (GGDEF)-like protein/PAS domain S-box-containing protein
LVGTPADAALSRARTNLVTTLVLGSLSLLVGATLAAWLGARIAQPLRRLAYDAMLFARGNLAHRTSVSGEDETGVLAGTLNRMAHLIEDRTRALQEKTAALERSTAELATITANVPVVISYIDADQRFRFINDYARDVFGFAPDQAVGRTLRETFGSAAYARLEERLADVLAGVPQTFETNFTPDGKGPVFIVTCIPDYGERKQVRGAYVVCQDVTALRDAKQALVASERRMRMVADNLPALIAYLDADERYLFVNARCRQMFGLEPEAIVGRTVRELFTPEAYAQTAPRIAGVLRGRHERFQRTVTRNGRECSELVELIPDQDAQGNVVGFYGLVQDVTDLRDAQTRAEDSEQRLRRITDNIPSMVGYIDRERRYRFNSRYYETWLGRPLSEITGRLVSEVLGPEAYATVRPNLDRAFAGERVDFDVEAKDAAGARFVRGTYIPDIDAAGQVVGVYSSSTDITPLKQVERQLERLAQNDTLTGLPNRHMFNDGIAAALRRSQRTGTQVALLFLDIDGFKRINDTLGHAAGDDVLREFGRRLSASVRATDLVARLAGDEFVIVLEGIHTREECRFVARKIIAAMRNEFRAGDGTIKVTTSIGIALGHGDAITPEALLKRADSALYAAKGQGRDRFEMAI